MIRLRPAPPRRGARVLKRLAAAAIAAAAVVGAAMADAPLRNPQVDIAYGVPGDPAFMPLYEGLQKRKALEELRAFLAPLRLPRRLTIELEQCGAPSKPYQPGGPVTICYEYVARLAALAAKIPEGGVDAHGLTREDAVAGAFIQGALQQTASAVLDVLEIPVWGREQDAADKLAAFLMLQFGPAAARKLIDGAAFFFEASGRTWTGADFSDVQSPEAQRYYNYVCIAYGSDKRLYHDYGGADRTGGRRKSGELSEGRTQRCAGEYAAESDGVRAFILPHVDADLLGRVLARDWLQKFDE